MVTSAVSTGTSSTVAQTISAANSLIRVGMLVTGNQIVTGTYVSAISGTSLTLSAAPAAATVAATFVAVSSFLYVLSRFSIVFWLLFVFSFLTTPVSENKTEKFTI